MLKDSRTSNYNYLSFYAPLLWQYFRLPLGLMTVTAFLTYVLGLLHRHWTPTSVLASIHYILSGVLLYGYYTPLYVLSLLHGHCTLPYLLFIACTLHVTCVLTHEHSTPQAHSAQLSRVQSWRCTLNRDEMLRGLCPFLKTKLAQLFHSERTLDVQRTGQSVPARPLSPSLKTSSSCDHFQNPGINSG